MNDEVIGLVAVILLFGGGTLFLLAISPIGKAIAARMLGRRTGVDEDALIEQVGELRREVEALKAGGGLDELDQVRREVGELAERVDFAERLLAKQREGERLSPPRA